MSGLFGKGPGAGGGAGSLPARSGGYGSPRGSAPPAGSYGAPSPGRMPPGQTAGGYGRGYGAPQVDPYQTAQPRQQGRGTPLRLAKVDDKNLQNQYIFGDLCAVSPRDFPSRDGQDIYVRLTGRQIRGEHVVTARPTQGFPDGCISLSDPQRNWLGVGMMDELEGEIYDPFSQGSAVYIGSMDVEIGFASSKRVTDTPYDQDELAQHVAALFQNHILAPGQRLLMDIKNVYLGILVQTVTLVDLSMEKNSGDAPARSDPLARGILTNHATINFTKDSSTSIKLKGSARRPKANAIISPNFKFEDMGIGGLDQEFTTIFRRAFASRIFPPGLIDRLGIMHVKGMLLYGPPGTGKTLIARQIGAMLNARPPKIINGPEVLNKYVGQSEENIRKLFADAEREYKDRGDESELHIIIFDELDAVCKQRGSGAGGGTGVGDSVVNQLLSKLDGVDQLNNILLIGMTNRKDMIDDALLRPGRLEVQIEISLPDEAGRAQILKIHTSKMLQNNVLGADVDIGELAASTKNFSGAELNGLVKSATSFAFNRHIKVGTLAGVSDSVADMKVEMDDFRNALTEVHAAFGTDEGELETALLYGIIHFSDTIQTIVDNGLILAEGVRNHESQRLMSVLLHGPGGSGKTALAAHIALQSDFPFIKVITPYALVGYRDEGSKKDYVHKTFADAYKSPLSIIILDNLERLIEWNPMGPRLSNTMTQALITLLQKPPPKGHRLLIMATTSQKSTMEQLDIADAFLESIAVPAVANSRQLATILHKANVFDSVEEIKEAVNLVGTDDIGVGIKNILALAGGTRSSADSTRWFAERLSAQIAKFNPRV